MTTRNQFRVSSVLAVAALAVVLLAPVAARAQDQLDQMPDQAIAAAPAGPSWDETSGYGAVERSRAAIAPDALAGRGASGPTGHEASAAIGYSWDETSGYGAVEESRAAARGQFAAPATIANQVPGDARWAPAGAIATGTAWDETSGYGAVEENRAVINADVGDGPVVQVVPPAREIGGLQEEYLFAKATAPSWDETSGYVAVEENRAVTPMYGPR